jgi:hypothetical protein
VYSVVHSVQFVVCVLCVACCRLSSSQPTARYLRHRNDPVSGEKMGVKNKVSGEQLGAENRH